MNPTEESPTITPDQARAHLDGASDVTLTTQQDRRIHAASLALAGITMGAFVALSRLLRDHEPWDTITLVAYCLGIGAVFLWPTRRASTIPRHIRRLSLTATTASAALLIVAIIGLNVARAEAELDGGTDWSTTPWVLIPIGVVVALPMLWAAVRALRTE